MENQAVLTSKEDFVSKKNYDIDIDAVIARLQEASGVHSISALSKAMFGQPTKISVWKSRGNISGEGFKEIIGWCRRKGISVQWVLFEEGPMKATSHNYRQTESDNVTPLPDDYERMVIRYLRALKVLKESVPAEIYEREVSSFLRELNHILSEND